MIALHTKVIALLDGATAPSRELDAAIWLACFEPTCPEAEVQFATEQYGNYLSRTSIDCALGSMWVDQMEPPLLPYTASVDHVIALIERILPGYLCGVWHTSQWVPEHKWGGKPVWDALIADPGDSDSYEPWCDHDAYDDYDDIEEHRADHCTAALALCSAMMRALAAREHVSPQADGMQRSMGEKP